MIQIRLIKYNNLKNVGAIIPVHFGGNPTDIKKLQVLRKKNIKIIEDAAHALEDPVTNADPKLVHVSILIFQFSLHPVKTIAAGEGGIITTNDKFIKNF